MPQKSGTPTRRHFQNCCTVFQSACDDILHRPPWKHVAWWSMMIHLRRSGQLKAAWRTSTREDNKGILAILDGNQSWKRRCSVSGCRQDYKTDQNKCVNGIRFEWHSSYIIDFIEIMMVRYYICQFKKPRAAHQIINGWLLWCHACSKCNAKHRCYILSPGSTPRKWIWDGVAKRRIRRWPRPIYANGWYILHRKHLYHHITSGCVLKNDRGLYDGLNIWRKGMVLGLYVP